MPAYRRPRTRHLAVRIHRHHPLPETPICVGSRHAMNTRPLAAALLFGLLMTALVVVPAAAVPTHRIGGFAPGSLGAWQHKSFKGETQYRLVGHGDTRALQAT